MTYNYSSRLSYSNELKPKDKDLPIDTVSHIVWDQNNTSQPTFLTSSWDGHVRLYSIRNSSSIQEVEKIWDQFLQHPVLCADINQNGIVFAGLASGDVAAVQCSTGNVIALGVHDAPICGIFWVREMGCLMTLGYDNLIKFWTVDSSNAFQMQFKLPFKTTTCSFDFPWLLVGSVETTIAIINIKGLPNIYVPKESSYQRINIERFSKFNCSRISNATNTVALGTVDGRVLIFAFREASNGEFVATNPYVTRVQKRMERNMGLYCQVNTVDIGFHNYEPFVAIGGSQDLAAYNIVKRSKVKTLATSSTQVGASTACRFSPKNDYVAFATGNDWLRGIQELEFVKRPRVGVVKLSNSDLTDFVAK